MGPFVILFTKQPSSVKDKSSTKQRTPKKSSQKQFTNNTRAIETARLYTLSCFPHSASSPHHPIVSAKAIIFRQWREKNARQEREGNKPIQIYVYQKKKKEERRERSKKSKRKAQGIRSGVIFEYHNVKKPLILKYSLCFKCR